MDNWHHAQNALTRTWMFADFSQAFAFAARAALVAEKLNHHPQIIIAWGKVTITTTTHDAQSTVTQKDHALAAELDKLT